MGKFCMIAVIKPGPHRGVVSHMGCMYVGMFVCVKQRFDWSLQFTNNSTEEVIITLLSVTQPSSDKVPSNNSKATHTLNVLY